MLLYSRLPLASCDVRFAVTDDVPSMRAVVQLRSGGRAVTGRRREWDTLAACEALSRR